MLRKSVNKKLFFSQYETATVILRHTLARNTLKCYIHLAAACFSVPYNNLIVKVYYILYSIPVLNVHGHLKCIYNNWINVFLTPSFWFLPNTVVIIVIIISTELLRRWLLPYAAYTSVYSTCIVQRTYILYDIIFISHRGVCPSEMCTTREKC